MVETAQTRKKAMSHFALIAISVLLASQIGSYLINSMIPLGDTVVINEFIHFTHIRNLGGVFGMFQGKGWIFGLLSVLLVAGLVVYLARSPSAQYYEYICFGFIAGGGSSNILDRLIYGSVIDFINIQHIPSWHYIFNTADVMVHVGLWPMLFFSLKSPEKPATS